MEGPAFWFADSLVVGANGASKIAEKRLRFSPEAQTWFLEERVPLEFFTRSGAMPVTWDYVVRSGTLATDEVWKAGDTIFISATLTVGPGVLTIEPDCCVKINAGQELAISTGKVIAKGLPYRPITFTSADDPRCGEPITGYSPGKPNRCLVINAGSDPTWQIEFCRFNKTVLSNLTVTADSTTGIQASTVRNCVFKAETSGNHGLSVTSRGGQTHTVSIENNLFENDPTSGGSPVGIYAGTPSPSSFFYTIRNNTFVKWYYGIYIASGAGYGSTVKQNIFSNVTGPDYVNIASTWLKNGYYQSPYSYRDSSPITPSYYPFDATTAPSLGLYYLNNVSGGGAYLRWAGADTAKGVFGPNYRQFKFQAPERILAATSGGILTITSTLTISPQYDYYSDNDNVSIGFHAPRVDNFHNRNLIINVGQDQLSLEVDPDSVVAIDSSGPSSPYINASRARIGGTQSSDKWVTFVDWRSAITIADIMIAPGNPDCSKCFATSHVQQLNTEYIHVGGDVTTVRRARFLWLGFTSGSPSATAAALHLRGNNLPGSEARDLEFYGCIRGMYYHDTGGPIPVINCLFYLKGNAAIAVGGGKAQFDLCTIDSCPLGIYEDLVSPAGTRIIVRNSIFTEITDDPNTSAKEAAIKVFEDSSSEDYNAFAQVTYPIVFRTGPETETVAAMSGRSYNLGPLPYDRIAYRERSVWFLKGRYSQTTPYPSEILVEDGGGGLGSDFGVNSTSTNRRAIRDDGPVDLGYHVADFPDGDADGMPDSWEQHFGLNPSSAADAGTDLDADGLSNVVEFQRGTKPNAIDTDVDSRLDPQTQQVLARDPQEAFVWQYNWASDSSLALTVDALRRNDFFFSGNLADFQGTLTQRGGPIQTALQQADATFQWSTPLSGTASSLWMRRSNAASFTEYQASSGNPRILTVAGLETNKIYFVKSSDQGSLGRQVAWYPRPSSGVFDTEPYLQNPSNLSSSLSKLTVKWRTTSATSGNKVLYRLGGSATYTEVTEVGTGARHSVDLLNLSPAVLYFYKVESGGPQNQSREYTFTAPRYLDPQKLQRVTVAVHGNSRAEGTSEFSYAHARVADAILGLRRAPDLDFAVSVGEVYQSGLGPYTPHLWWPARDLMATVPLFVAPGEKEYGNDASLANFREFFAYPPHNVPGQGNRAFYSFNYGPCYFIVLDTGAEGVPGSASALTHKGGPGIDTQHEWLVDKLREARAMSPRPFTCVFMHKPVATDSDAHPWTEIEIQNLRTGTGSALEAFGVDVVFQGHSSAYERFKYSFTDPAATADVHRDFGVHHVVTGGAGALPARVRLGNDLPPSAGVAGRQRGLSTYNFCVLAATRDAPKEDTPTTQSLELKAYELGGPGVLDLLTLAAPYPHPKVVLIDKYTEPGDAYRWKFFQNGDPGVSWNTLGYNDGAWNVASFAANKPREFGFGDGDEEQLFSSGQGPYYIRRRFPLVSGNIASGDVVELRCVVADGCEVYLDGGNLGGPVQVTSIITSNRPEPMSGSGASYGSPRSDPHPLRETMSSRRRSTRPAAPRT